MSAIKGTDVYGNVSVGRNVAAGGNARVNGNIRVGHNLKVEGWLEAPNIKDVNKGIFQTLAELQAAYPNPKDGWFAGVGASTPFAAYAVVNGEWVSTGGTIDVDVDLAHYDAVLDEHGQAIGDLESAMVKAENEIDMLKVLANAGYRISGFIGPNNSYLAKAVENSCYVGMWPDTASWFDGVGGRVWLPPTDWAPQGEGVVPSSVSGWTCVNLTDAAYDGFTVLFGYRDGKWTTHRLPYAFKDKVDNLEDLWASYIAEIRGNKDDIDHIESLLSGYYTGCFGMISFVGDRRVIRAGESQTVNFTFDTELDFEGGIALELYANEELVGSYTVYSREQLPYHFGWAVNDDCLFKLRAKVNGLDYVSVWDVEGGYDFWVGTGATYGSVLANDSARHRGDSDMSGTYSLSPSSGQYVFIICRSNKVPSDVKMSGYLFPMVAKEVIEVSGVEYAVYRSANSMQSSTFNISIGGVGFDKGSYITHLLARMQELADVGILIEEKIETIADEETITINENSKVALKNRPMKRDVTTNEVVQKGYVILKKNDSFKSVVEGYTDGNVIFEIDYAFDLGGKSVSIPEGCVLKFEGGKISNGTLIGNGTNIVASQTVIFTDITIDGSWSVGSIYSDWMHLPADDCGVQMRNLMNLQSDEMFNHIYINGTHKYTPFGSSALTRTFIFLKSHSYLHLGGTLIVNPNNLESYGVIRIENGKEDITIDGGAIVGDVGEHIYISGSTSELGMGIRAYGTKSLTIKNINISKCIGDGIYLGGGAASSADDYSQGIQGCVVSNVVVDDCRRTGVAITAACDGFVLENSVIKNIGLTENTPLYAAMDIEPNNVYDNVRNILIDNCLIENNKATILFNNQRDNGLVWKNITIRNTRIDNGASTNSSYPGIKLYLPNILRLRGDFENFNVENCNLLGAVSYPTPDTSSDDYVSTINFRGCNIKGLLNKTNTTDYTRQAVFNFDNCSFVFGSDEAVNPNSYDGIIHINNNLVQCKFNNCTFKANSLPSALNFSYLASEGLLSESELSNCVIETNRPVKGFGRYKNCNITAPNVYVRVNAESKVEGCTLTLTSTSSALASVLVELASDAASVSFYNNTIISTNTGTKSPIRMQDDNVSVESVSFAFRGNNFNTSSQITYFWLYWFAKTVSALVVNPIDISINGSQTSRGTLAGLLAVGHKGLRYFDTTNNKPLWWNGTAWVDATGTVVS